MIERAKPIHEILATTSILTSKCVPVRWACLLSISEAYQHYHGLTDWQADRYLYAIADQN